MTQTAAVRTPAMIVGSASGSSTWISDCIGVMPTPMAACLIEASTPSTPVIVFRRIGSIE